MDNRCILLIEDNPDDVLLTRIAFEEANIANPLVVLEDGADALDYLLRIGRHEGRDDGANPSVVLLDLNLPKVSGVEILRAIREHDDTRHLPVIVLTTSSEPIDVDACYELGVNSYIQKPVDFQQFVQAVKQIGLYWLVLNHAPE